MLSIALHAKRSNSDLSFVLSSLLRQEERIDEIFIFATNESKLSERKGNIHIVQKSPMKFPFLLDYFFEQARNNYLLYLTDELYIPATLCRSLLDQSVYGNMIAEYCCYIVQGVQVEVEIGKTYLPLFFTTKWGLSLVWPHAQTQENATDLLFLMKLTGYNVNKNQSLLTMQSK